MWKNSSFNLLFNFVHYHISILNSTLFNVVKRFDIQSFAQFCLMLWKELPCNILLNFVQCHYWICHIIIYSTLLNVVKRSIVQFNSVWNSRISFVPIKINLIKLLPKCIRKHMERPKDLELFDAFLHGCHISLKCWNSQQCCCWYLIKKVQTNCGSPICLKKKWQNSFLQSILKKKNDILLLSISREGDKKLWFSSPSQEKVWKNLMFSNLFTDPNSY
jgi:hypothetical protein